MDKPLRQAERAFLDDQREHYLARSRSRAERRADDADKKLAGRVFELLIVVSASMVTAAWIVEQVPVDGVPGDVAACVGGGLGILMMWKNRRRLGR